ncbi:hypothetical protein BH24ACT22_BH24ACT22_11770 [soil metagenome]
MVERYSRRRFLKLAGFGAVGVSLTAVVGCEAKGNLSETTSEEAVATVRPAPKAVTESTVATTTSAPPGSKYVQAFRSRPDLSPPTIGVSTTPRDTAPGYVFIAPKEAKEGQYGAMVVDEQGRMVWFKPVKRQGDYVMDCKVQTYKGEPVLTFWEGRVTNGFGLGEYSILDGSYNEIGRVRSVGYQGDHHDFTLTSRDTALFTIYNPLPANLSGIGRRVDDAAIEGVIQEIDVASGEVLFEWHSLDHVGPEESYEGVVQNATVPYDYFHINSIDVDDDDNLIVSARKTYTVYKIDRETGEIIWRLGGKNSDFEMGPGCRPAEQHDARRQADGTITIFDNGALKPDARSFGLTLGLDTTAMTASLVREYSHPDQIFAENQANMQVLPNGNVFIGWGSEPFFSEFSRDGQLLHSANLPPEAESYRAFKFPWEGQLANKPDVTTEPGPDGATTLYVSWNGATQVDNWQVLAGPRQNKLKPAGFVPRKDFETAILVDTKEPYLIVQGRDASNKVLGASKAVEL